LTAESSARWANAIIAGNDAQYRLARDAQHRHIRGLKAAISTIEKRLAHQRVGRSAPAHPRRARTRHLGRATVTPAPANNGQLEQ
jgi:hypothetical protein